MLVLGHMLDMGVHSQGDDGGQILSLGRHYEQKPPLTLRLLEKRQEGLEVQRALGARSADFRSSMEALGRRWEETRAQTSLIGDHVLTFRHLIVENEMKSQQEVKKSRRERESSALKEQQVLHLQEEKAALIRRRHRVQNQIQQYTKFCHFLERTVETSGEFQVLGDVLSRFRTLEDTSRYLQHVLQEAQAATDQVRASRQLQDKHDEALQLDNQLGRLQADLEEAQNQRLMWESRWAHIQNTATKTTLLIGTLKMAALNLFHCTAAQDGGMGTGDTTTQLDMVQRHLQELAAICETTRRQITTNPAGRDK